MNLFTLDDNSINYGLGNDNLHSNGELALLMGIIKDNMTILDIGANRGNWAKLALKLAKLKEIVCFEPIPETFRELVSILAEFPNSRAINCAVCDKTDKASIFWYKNNPGFAEMSNLYGRPEVEQRLNIKKESVEVLTLALNDFEDSIKHIDYMKVDVEGAELAVLKGANKFFDKKKIDALQFEYGGCAKDSGITLKEIIDFLWSYKFKVGRIVPNGIIYIDRWDDRLENYQHSNYFAASSRVWK